MPQELSPTYGDLFALNRLGARSAREIKDKDGKILRIEVEPDLPLDKDGAPKGYAAMISELQESATVPVSVSSAQAKIQLLRSPAVGGGKTLLDDVTEAVKAAGGEVAIWFAEARTWERGNPYVASLSGGLKLTSSQVDDLFRAAAQVEA